MRALIPEQGRRHDDLIPLVGISTAVAEARLVSQLPNWSKVSGTFDKSERGREPTLGKLLVAFLRSAW